MKSQSLVLAYILAGYWSPVWESTQEGYSLGKAHLPPPQHHPLPQSPGTSRAVRGWSRWRPQAASRKPAMPSTMTFSRHSTLSPQTTGKPWCGGRGDLVPELRGPRNWSKRAGLRPVQRSRSGGKVQYSPCSRPATSGRNPDDGGQPAGAARREAQGQRETRGRCGPEQQTRGSQQGCHGSAYPRQDARSCRGPGGTRDDPVAPSETNQGQRAASGGGGGAPPRLTGKASRARGLTWIRLLFYNTPFLSSDRTVPVSVSSAPALNERGHVTPPFCSW